METPTPRTFILVGCCLLVASFVVYNDSTHSLQLFAPSRVNPALGRLALRSQPERQQPDQDPYNQGPWEVATGVAIVGAAGAVAETEHLISHPWAATGLSLAFVAAVLYFFDRRPRGPGLALAGPAAPGMPPAADELDLAEMAARPMAMSTSGSGKVSGELLITVDKPLGLTLGEKKSTGGVEVTFVNPLGNAAKAGIKPGDTVIYTSSFFGDELWPSDKLAFTRSAITACPNAVDFIVMRGAAADQVNVKRLPKRPAPPKIGRKLTAAQKARATHICLDCGYIYALPTPFDEQGADYRCPQCQARKNRFSKYDVETGQITGGSSLPPGILTGVLGGAGLVVLLGYIALSL